MSTNIFNTREIIIIVMAMIEDIKNETIYGIESDELNIPNNINEKINNLSDVESCEFFCLMDKICDKVYNLKNGELHELNIIHKEIIEFSNMYLKKYML